MTTKGEFRRWTMRVEIAAAAGAPKQGGVAEQLLDRRTFWHRELTRIVRQLIDEGMAG